MGFKFLNGKLPKTGDGVQHYELKDLVCRVSLLIVVASISEARVTPEHSPLSWCARALAEEIFAYSLAVV